MLKPESIKIFNEETNVNFFAWQIIIEGFFRSRLLKKFISTPDAQTAHLENDHGRSGIELTSWNNLGEHAMMFMHMRAWDFKKLLDYHYQTGGKILSLYKTIRKQDLSKVSNKQMLAWFLVLWENFMELNGIGMVPVVSDYEHEALSTELRDILKSHGVKPNKQLEYANVLMSPTDPLETWNERRDLISLAIKHKTLPKTLASSDFKKHLEKYEWHNYGYQGPAMSERDFTTQLEKIFTAKYSPKQLLKEHAKHLSDLQKQQKKLITKLKLSPKEKYLFEAARVFTFAKGYRIDVRHHFHFLCDKMFEELGRRFSLPVKWFRYSTRPEITQLLQGKKVDTRIALERSKKVLWVIEKDTDYFVPTAKIPEFYKKYVIEEKAENSDTLKGQPAYLGKVRGRVKIVKSEKDIHKVQHGDVLVAITTNPDLLPAMYRAIAFVTDTGGITSHAAIVAREMKKPCIIGTRTATKVLKDGDLVEVDANKGTVRKL